MLNLTYKLSIIKPNAMFINNAQFYFASIKNRLNRDRRSGRNCSGKKVFLKISQNSQENTCARVFFFNKFAGLRPATLLKKRLWCRCFSVNFAEFLRTPFSQNTSEGLFLALLIGRVHSCLSQ